MNQQTYRPLLAPSMTIKPLDDLQSADFNLSVSEDLQTPMHSGQNMVSGTSSVDPIDYVSWEDLIGRR